MVGGMWWYATTGAACSGPAASGATLNLSTGGARLAKSVLMGCSLQGVGE
jgi:hypothetical protein